MTIKAKSQNTMGILITTIINNGNKNVCTK